MVFLESNSVNIWMMIRISASDVLVGWIATLLDPDQGKSFNTLTPATRGRYLLACVGWKSKLYVHQ